jgi:hypothetical protein
MLKWADDRHPVASAIRAALPMTWEMSILGAILQYHLLRGKNSLKSWDSVEASDAAWKTYGTEASWRPCHLFEVRSVRF